MSTAFRRILDCSNKLLQPLSLRLETMTAENYEAGNLKEMEANGHFDHPAYFLPKCMEEADPSIILEGLPKYSETFESFSRPPENDNDFSFANSFFTSPDAEVLYTIVREREPKRIVETGCGNSTRIIRRAVEDGKLETKLTSVDPFPRESIAGLADEVLQTRIEAIASEKLISDLSEGDILFIDTSHEARACNDVAHIFCNLIPMLPKGVFVHVHDIFLPWEYPKNWILDDKRWSWSEQYLLHSLISSNHYKIIWPGYYLQRTHERFEDHFPNLGSGKAQSFWFVS